MNGEATKTRQHQTKIIKRKKKEENEKQNNNNDNYYNVVVDEEDDDLVYNNRVTMKLQKMKRRIQIKGVAATTKNN